MISFLALLPRSLTTFLYALAALLRFYGNIDTTPINFIPLTTLQWSFLAFSMGSAALLANLSLVDLWSFVEWNAGNRATNERARAKDEADRERERAARRARIQTRYFILQIRHQLTPGPEAQAALTDFLSFLLDYGEF